MKLCRILLLMIMLAPFTAQAQEKNMQVEVYLKDRSIVRGTIIEEIPQVSITLQTEDGNIVVYKTEEIEKYRQDYFQQTNKVKKTNGYRGFVEVGYSVASWGHRLEITTSHGYQILPDLFIGIGTGIMRVWRANAGNTWNIPIFADIRYDVLKKPLTLFIDLKIGDTVWEDAGFYMSPSIGCRFPVDDAIGLNVRLGCSMQCTTYYDWYYQSKKRCFRGAFTATVGVDF